MATKHTVSQQSPSQYYPYNNQNDTPPLGPRKTIFVLATVIGCIAILWPKIFYPMMFGSADVPIKNNYINKDMKPGGKSFTFIDNIFFSELNAFESVLTDPLKIERMLRNGIRS